MTRTKIFLGARLLMRASFFQSPKSQLTSQRKSLGRFSSIWGLEIQPNFSPSQKFFKLCSEILWKTHWIQNFTKSKWQIPKFMNRSPLKWNVSICLKFWDLRKRLTWFLSKGCNTWWSLDKRRFWTAFKIYKRYMNLFLRYRQSKAWGLWPVILTRLLVSLLNYLAQVRHMRPSQK